MQNNFLIFLAIGIVLLGTTAGQNQPLPPACTTILDFGVLLDSSGSVGDEDFQKAKEILKVIVDKFNVTAGKVHFGYIYYSSNVTLDQGFIPKEQFKAIIKGKIDKIPYHGGTTATGEALLVARTQLFHEKRDSLAPRMAVVITDGYSDEGLPRVNQESQLLKNEGVEVVAIGIGISNDDELKAIASFPKNVLQMSSYQMLANQINLLTQQACNTNAVLPFQKNADVITEKDENRFFLTDVTSVDPDYEYINLDVVQKNGRVNIYCSTKEKNPDETNSRAALPVHTTYLKNGWQRNSYWYFVEKGDKNFFFTVQGVDSINDSDLNVQKLSVRNTAQMDAMKMVYSISNMAY